MILGTCTLWVKHGAVSLYGATIQASTAVHRVYAPSTHALPAIEALSSKAEFQLDSLEDGLIDLPSIGARDLWVPPNVQPTASSFYLLGHSFDLDPKAPRRLKELNLVPWKTIITGVLPPDDVPSTTASSTILICGRRSSGVSTLARCMLNRVLTKPNMTTNPSRLKGALVLDLDTNMPEFAPPGTISLVQVGGPLLGPPFTHVLTTGGRSSRTLRTHFLGDLHFTDLCNSHIDRVLDLLDLAKQHYNTHQGTPVFILPPKWWNGIERNLASQLWMKMAPTDIVCLDSNPMSPHLQSWKSLAESNACRIHQVPAQVFDKIHPAREHDLQVQSYFHLLDSSIERPVWNDMPILAGTYREITLTYGTNDDADVCAVLLLGGHVALEDTYDALEGNLVAMVAVKRDATKNVSRNSHYPDKDPGAPRVSRTQEGLPRLQGGMQSLSAILGKHSFCVALAIVVKIDIPSQRIALVNGHGLQEIEVLRQGYQVALVLQKATSDGRFRPDWARKEMRAGERAA